MSEKIAKKLISTGIHIASENASGAGESSKDIIESSSKDLEGWIFAQECLRLKSSLVNEINYLKSQLAKKDEIIKELKEYSNFLSQYSDCDEGCSWARHSSRCRSVTKRALDHKNKIEELEK